MDLIGSKDVAAWQAASAKLAKSKEYLGDEFLIRELENILEIPTDALELAQITSVVLTQQLNFASIDAATNALQSILERSEKIINNSETSRSNCLSLAVLLRTVFGKLDDSKLASTSKHSNEALISDLLLNTLMKIANINDAGYARVVAIEGCIFWLQRYYPTDPIRNLSSVQCIVELAWDIAPNDDLLQYRVFPSSITSFNYATFTVERSDSSFSDYEKKTTQLTVYY